MIGRHRGILKHRVAVGHILSLNFTGRRARGEIELRSDQKDRPPLELLYMRGEKCRCG